MPLSAFMIAVDVSKTVKQLVTEHEETRSVFLRHHVQPDHVALTLAGLCDERGIDRSTLEHELTRAMDEAEAFDVGGFDWDVRGRVVHLSPNHARLLGLAETSVDARALLDRVHPDDRWRVERCLSSAAERPHGFTFEYRVSRPDGSFRLLATRLEPIGRGSTSFVGTSWDITRQRPHGGPETSSSLLQSAVEVTLDGLLVVGRAGNATVYNDRFLSLWRIPTDVAAKGTDDALLTFVLDQLDDPRAFLAGVNQLYDNPERESFDVLRFRDGRVFERYSRPQRSDFGVVRQGGSTTWHAPSVLTRHGGSC